MIDTAIRTESLSKFYGELHALEGVTLHVPRGSVYGFLGRNGAGKTTTITMRLLLGLARPTSGTAHVLGLETGKQQREILDRTAFVRERKVLYDNMTPRELVHFTSGFYPRWSPDAVERYARVLDIPMKQKFGKLSHGNRSKVCVLLALGQNADLLILDEPSDGLDPLMIDDLLRVLLDQQADRKRSETRWDAVPFRGHGGVLSTPNQRISLGAGGMPVGKPGLTPQLQRRDRRIRRSSRRRS
jgi:ABC-2 type transport system ATP-binding protein